MMHNRIQISGTELTLSPICLGTVNAGLSWDHEDAFSIFDAYLDKGGNVIDSARIYSDWVEPEIGRSERVLGDWIRHRGHHRDFTLITKGGHPRMEAIHTSRMNKSDMDNDIALSLKTLGVECIDLYFYHRDNTAMPVAEILGTMEGYVREGKIRYYGCSNWKTDRMQEAHACAKENKMRGFVANEALFNMGMKYMNPFPDDTMASMDDSMQAFHRAERGVLAMPYFGVCSGFFHLLDAKGEDAVKQSPYYTPGNLRVKAVIDRLRKKYNATISQILLGFFFAQDYPIVPLAGADTMAQLGDIMRTLDIKFDAADFAI
jgi:aryl-alcohol dehydrogenase-like predicted oxidoreductase